MNFIHIHLMVNHIPVIGILLGAPLLIAAMVLKNSLLRQISLIFLLIVSLMILPTYFSGEQAEESLEHHYLVNEHLIEEHEHAAETARNITLFLGLMVLGGLLYEWKIQDQVNANYAWGILLIALVAMGFLFQAANLGGILDTLKLEILLISLLSMIITSHLRFIF